MISSVTRRWLSYMKKLSAFSDTIESLAVSGLSTLGSAANRANDAGFTTNLIRWTPRVGSGGFGRLDEELDEEDEEDPPPPSGEKEPPGLNPKPPIPDDELELELELLPERDK